MKKLLICSLILISTQLFADPFNPGAIMWTVQLKAPSVASPTLSDDANTLYVGSTNGQLLALNAMDGTQKWQYQFAGGIYSPVAYDGDTQTIYVTTNAIDPSQTGGIYALDANTGAIINSMPIRGIECQFGRPTQADYLVVGTTDKPVAYSMHCASDGLEYAAIAEFSAHSPEFTPSLKYEQTSYDTSQFDSYRKKEIIFDNNPNLEGILTTSYGALSGYPEESIGPALADWNVLSGQAPLESARFWQGNIVPNVTFSTPVYDPNQQLIYIGGSDGNLYAYSTGSRGLNVAPVFVLQLGGDLSLNPPTVGFGGHLPAQLYIASDNGNLYSINITQSTNNSTKVVATLNWQLHISNAGFALPLSISGITGGFPLIYTTDKTGNVYAVVDWGTYGTIEPWANPLQNIAPINSPAVFGYTGAGRVAYLASNSAVYAVYGSMG